MGNVDRSVMGGLGRTQIMNGQALAWVRECMGRRHGG